MSPVGLWDLNTSLPFLLNIFSYSTFPNLFYIPKKYVLRPIKPLSGVKTGFSSSNYQVYERHCLWIVSFSWDQKLLTWVIFIEEHFHQMNAICFLGVVRVKSIAAILFISHCPNSTDFSFFDSDKHTWSHTQQHGSRARMSSGSNVEYTRGRYGH